MANDGTVKIGTELDDSGFKAGLSKLGGVAKSAVTGITAGLAGATAAVGALTKSALDAYASYEQLTGGIETLFGAGGKTIEEYAASVGKSVDEVSGDYQMLMDRQEQVFQNAANAYKTAGMSANEYMETVTGFSASLIQSLGEYSWQAASYADQAITDMSDNANKMGTDIEAIQYAYQGFAKQNYTMLDNLKLGYGGTKEEMERLLRDAEKLGGYIEGSLDISSFADIVDAIHIVQEELGITGTTAKEAATTIEGSVKSAKAAWTNLVVGIADDTQDFDTLVNNFVDSVAVAAENILPRIETILGGAGNLVGKLAPVIAGALPGLINGVLPGLISAAGDLLNSFAGVLPSLISTLVPVIIQFFTENVADFIDIGIEILLAIVTGISENVDLIIEAIPKIISSITGAISEHGAELKAAGEEILKAIADGLVDIAPFLEPVVEAIEYLVKNFNDFLPVITTVTASIVAFKTAMMIASIIQGVSAAITAFKTANEAATIAQAALNAVMNANPFVLIVTIIAGVVAAIITLWNTNEGFREAVTSAWEAIKETAISVWEAVSGAFTAAWDAIKSVWDAVQPYFQAIWDAILESVRPLAEAIMAAFQAAWSLIQTIWDAVEPYFVDIWNGIKSVFEPVGDALGGFFESAWNVIQSIWKAAQPYFQQQWELIKAVFSVAKDVLGGFFKTAWDAIVLVWNTATGFFEQIWNTIAGIFSAVESVLKGDFEGAWNAIKDVFSGWGDFFSGLWDDLVGFFSRAWETFSEIGGNIVNGIKNGIANAWDSLTSWVSEKFNALVSSVKSGLGIASPSKVFAKIGGFMADGVGVGWDDEFSDIQKDINKSLDFSAAIQKSIPIVRSVASSMVPRGVFGGQNVTNNTNSSMVFNINVSCASNREEARNIGREIGAEAQREMRRRGLVMA